MQVRVRAPGQAAIRAGADLRITVTFRDEDVLPLPLQVHFVHIVDSETGEDELRNVGVGLGVEELRTEELALEAPELTAFAFRRVVERYPHWLELARAHARLELSGPSPELLRRLKRDKPARLDDDWYRMVASEYRHHTEERDPAPITTIARSHGVTLSAASRWVKAARTRGFLKDVASGPAATY